MCFHNVYLELKVRFARKNSTVRNERSHKEGSFINVEQETFLGSMVGIGCGREHVPPPQNRNLIFNGENCGDTVNFKRPFHARAKGETRSSGKLRRSDPLFTGILNVNVIRRVSAVIRYST